MIIVLMSSCEKAVLPASEKDDPDKGTEVVVVDSTVNNPSKNDSTDNKGSSDSVIIVEADYISVDSAITLPEGALIQVKGYVVGSCSKTIKNAAYTVPTDYSQSILVADKSSCMDAAHILAVCLTDRSAARKVLNLHDNPHNLHRLIFLSGMRTKYLNTNGMKELKAYKLK